MWFESLVKPFVRSERQTPSMYVSRGWSKINFNFVEILGSIMESIQIWLYFWPGFVKCVCCNTDLLKSIWRSVSDLLLPQGQICIGIPYLWERIVCYILTWCSESDGANYFKHYTGYSFQFPYTFQSSWRTGCSRTEKNWGLLYNQNEKFWTEMYLPLKLSNERKFLSKHLLIG